VTLPLPVSTLLTNAIAMTLVMLVWLPQLSRVLGFWLLPSRPLPAWQNVAVIVGCLAVIAACTVVFLALLG
jgi:hypothetical protein